MVRGCTGKNRADVGKGSGLKKTTGEERRMLRLEKSRQKKKKKARGRFPWQKAHAKGAQEQAKRAQKGKTKQE